MGSMSRRLSAAQAAALVSVPPGGMRLVRVQHDEWCSYVVTGWCNCRPDVETEPATVETLASVTADFDAWCRERLS
jgi:hypothetical protein